MMIDHSLIDDDDDDHPLIDDDDHWSFINRFKQIQMVTEFFTFSARLRFMYVNVFHMLAANPPF